MAHYTENNAQGFTPTRPRAERIRFVSEYTGEHVLDTYLEHAERGGRSLSDLMSDIFNSSGQFNADLFEFRTSNSQLQIRVGIYSDPNTGWTDIQPVLRSGGIFATHTTYNQLEMVILGTKLYIVNADNQSFATAEAFEASANTDLLFDTAGVADTAEQVATQKAAEAAQSASDALGYLNQITTAVDAFEDPTTGSLTLAQAAATSATTTKSQIDTIYADIQTIEGNINANLTTSANQITSANNTLSSANTLLASVQSVANQNTTDIAAIQTAQQTNTTQLASIQTSQTALDASATSISNTQTQLTTDVATNTTNLASINSTLTDAGYLAVEAAISTSIATLYSNITDINDLADDFDDIETVTTIPTFAANITTLGPLSSQISTLAAVSSDIQAAAALVDLEDVLVIGPLILT
jgi:hypothetical protein